MNTSMAANLRPKMLSWSHWPLTFKLSRVLDHVKICLKIIFWVSRVNTNRMPHESEYGRKFAALKLFAEKIWSQKFSKTSKKCTESQVSVQISKLLHIPYLQSCEWLSYSIHFSSYSTWKRAANLRPYSDSPPYWYSHGSVKL